MPTQRHTRYPAEQWQAWNDEQSRSGQPQQVVYKRKGLSKSSFKHWQHRLASGTPCDVFIFRYRVGALRPGIDAGYG